MRLSARADYALRVVIELAAVTSGHVTADQLARAQSIPSKFLKTILTQLLRAGLIRRKRGREGGFWLARPASEISLADVIRAIDGQLLGARGERPENISYPGVAEPLKQVWIALRANERAVLEMVTLAHIVSGTLPDIAGTLTGSLPDDPRVPVRIYLKHGESRGLIELAVLGLLEAYGFAVEHREEPVLGSWFRQFWVRAKASAPPMEEQMVKLARGIELQGLDRPQSEVDLNQADAVTRLLSALDAESDALIQVGSIFLVKVRNKIVVRNLTQVELAFFNRNPALFQDPEAALRTLQRSIEE